eukprot:TRINITY_DN18924_c0_g1_i1.p1 TRINITY_DN18924_c0_g1~~TRINITY_DN18924_c0_g1_i1.p1  ORF type:complete len:137 (-),score=17.66 TRINITY_DN18924_c0_g1_i1:38-448(-)
MYSIADRRSFDRCGGWFEAVLAHTRQNVIVGLVGSKLDLEAEREVRSEEAAALASWEEPLCTRDSLVELAPGFPSSFIENSNKTGQTVERSLARVVCTSTCPSIRTRIIDDEARVCEDKLTVKASVPPPRSSCVVC